MSTANFLSTVSKHSLRFYAGALCKASLSLKKLKPHVMQLALKRQPFKLSKLPYAVLSQRHSFDQPDRQSS